MKASLSTFNHETAVQMQRRVTWMLDTITQNRRLLTVMKVACTKHCLSVATFLFAATFLLLGCKRSAPEDQITLYSGRNQHLLAPLLAQFTEETGIRVQTRYGGTSELAATILEEGKRSPADVFFAQDAGALGALSSAHIFRALPREIQESVPSAFRSQQGYWVGSSGRARVLIYNTTRVQEENLPASLAELAEPQWRERVGWAPLNASFQAFVTALRVERGDSATRDWLEAMSRNRPRSYARNTAIVQAVAAGEIDIGLTNHYYLHTMQRDQGVSLQARNHIPREGTLINVAGVGVLKTTRRPEQAEQFVRFLLSAQAQEFFTNETFEYPLVPSVDPNPALPRLDALPIAEWDLSLLEDLQGTLVLLQELEIL